MRRYHLWVSVQLPRLARIGLILAVVTMTTAATARGAVTDLVGNVSSSFLNHLGYAGDRATIKFSQQLLATPLPDAGCPTISSVEILTSNRQLSSFPLDCNAWSRKANAWVYKAISRGEGAIRSVVLDARAGKLAVKAKGEDYGLNAIGGPVSWIEVRLNVGDETYSGRLAPPRSLARSNNGEKVTLKGLAVACSETWPTPTPTPSETPKPTATHPKVVLSSPLHGSFSSGGSVVASGDILNVVDGTIVRVNGIPVVPVNNHFAVNVPLDAASTVNSIVAEIETAGQVVRDRVDVIVGDFLQQGESYPYGVGLQMGQGFLNRLEPLIAQQVHSSFQGIDLVPPGTGLHISGPPEVTFGISSGVTSGGFSFDASPSNGTLSTALSIPGFHFNLTAEVRIPMPYPIPDVRVGCTNIGLAVGQTLISGQYQLQPGFPMRVDEVGHDLNLGSVSTGGASCGGIPLDPLLSPFTSILTDALSDILSDPANAANGPIQTALQNVIGQFAVAPYGGSLLDGILTQVDEQLPGITMSWNAATLFAGTLPPLAPRLAGAFLPIQSLPSFGSLTPGGRPYDTAIALATSTLNQLLQSHVEGGAFAAQWEQIGATLLTPQALDALLPGLGLSERLGALTPLALRLSPAHHAQTWADGKPRGLAPLLTGNPGPNGAFGEMVLPYLSFDIVNLDSGEVVFNGVFEGRVGVDLNLVVDPDTGVKSIAVTVSDIDWSDIALLVLDDPSGLELAAIDLLLPIVLEQLEPLVQDALGQLPIPQLAGYDLSQIELDQIGDFTIVYASAN